MMGAMTEQQQTPPEQPSVSADLSKEEARRLAAIQTELAQLRRLQEANEKRSLAIAQMRSARSQRREVARVMARQEELTAKSDRLKAELALLQQGYDASKDERALKAVDRAQEITVTCPKDGEQIKVTMGQVVDGETITCPQCASTIGLNPVVTWTTPDNSPTE